MDEWEGGDEGDSFRDIKPVLGGIIKVLNGGERGSFLSG